MLRVECVHDAKGLDALADDLNRLSGGAFMQRLTWLLPWWESHSSNHQLRILVAYRGEQVCGIFPLAETYSAWTGVTWVFMGSGKVCSDDLGILAQPKDSREVVDALVEWLLQTDSGFRWDHLNLDGVRAENATMRYFAERIMQRSGNKLEEKKSPNCWSVPLEGGVDAYMNRLSRRVRKIIRDGEKAIASGNMRFRVAQSLEEAMQFLDTVEQLHQKRWETRGIQGCFADDPFSRFLHSAIPLLWNDPWVRQGRTPMQRVALTLLEFDGQPAAGTICIGDRNSLAIYLTGMSPEFSEHRPGWVVNAQCINLAIQWGCERFDFLRGDEEYKERLGGEPTVQQRWLIASPRWTSLIRNAAYRTASTVKSWWTQSATTPTPAS